MNNKISSFIQIPEGMYFVPKVHRSLLAYRTLSKIEKNESLEKAVLFAQEFIQKNSHQPDMVKIYKSALNKFQKQTSLSHIDTK